MGSLDSWVTEAREFLSQILDTLIEANQQRSDAAKDKPPARALSKLDVVAEANLRSIPFEAGRLTPVLVTQAGIYTKVNHWAAQLEAEDELQLYYGQDAQAVAILDSAPAKSKFPVANPNELVIPPNMNVYVLSPKAGIISLAVTTYRLTV